jgi:hypothetical protein
MLNAILRAKWISGCFPVVRVPCPVCSDVQHQNTAEPEADGKTYDSLPCSITFQIIRSAGMQPNNAQQWPSLVPLVN